MPEEKKRRLQILVDSALGGELQMALLAVRRYEAVKHLHRGPIREGAIVEAALSIFLPALQLALRPSHQTAPKPLSALLAHPSPLHGHLVAAVERAAVKDISHALSLRGALVVAGLGSLSERRALPWRRESDLYRLYLAEVLLRRTTRSRAAKAYKALVDLYPTASHLSKATPDQLASLLRLYRVGLYSRSAKIIKGAAFMRDLDIGALNELDHSHMFQKLKSLPLVGNYTAEALALHALRVAVLPLDNNASRVLWRALQGKNPPRNIENVYNDPHLLSLRERLLAYSTPRTAQLTHFGVLDIGWNYCKPARPKCELCPLTPLCTYALSR